jgi:hypothetical protein
MTKPAKSGSRRERRKRSTGGRVPTEGTGLPARDAVREIIPFTSAQGKPYQILRTTETDAYDPPARSPSSRKKRR